MTDNEIIKAWEKIMESGDAPIGEHWSVGTVVTTILAKETLDMLNRQKAKIAVISVENANLKITCGEQTTEIEKLREAIIAKNLTPTAYKVMQEKIYISLKKKQRML